MFSNNGLCLPTMCSMCYMCYCIIFSTGGKFRLVSNFTELHTLTLAACSYALLVCYYMVPDTVQKTAVHTIKFSPIELTTVLTHRFTDLKDPNDWLYSFNPCYTYSQQQCQNVYVSDSGVTYYTIVTHSYTTVFTTYSNVIISH